MSCNCKFEKDNGEAGCLTVFILLLILLNTCDARDQARETNDRIQKLEQKLK